MTATAFNSALADTKISAVDGAAFLDCGASGSALLRFLGDKVTVTDSAGKSIVGYIKAIGTGETFPSQYPLAQLDAYVKATTKASGSNWPFYATDPAKPLTGTSAANSWLSLSGVNSNQRFHIDLGSAKPITRIYYENYHTSGNGPTIGVKTFTLWGSNDPAAFAELTYGTDTGWTQLPTSQATFDAHSGADAADPKYITVTNVVAYRYYAIKIADNWGYATYVGIRRIELQQQATPAATGVTITSLSGGTVYSWTSKDAAFNYADASGYTVTITNSSIEVYAYRILTADAATARRVNTRIYPVVMPQDVILPAVSYQRVSADPVNTLSGYAGLMNAHIVINSWARTYDDCKALAVEIRTAMNAATAFKSIMVNELDGYDPEVSLFVVSQDFSVWGEE